MCKEESFLVTKDTVLYRWELTSHSDLFDFYGLRDDGRNAIPCEIYPDDPKDWDKPEKWKLHIDCDIRPEWLDAARMADAADEMRAIVSPYILRRDAKIITSGAWIVTAGRIGKVITPRLIAVSGGEFAYVRGGEFANVSGGEFDDVSGGEFANVSGGEFAYVSGGEFANVWGGVQILRARRGHVIIKNDNRTNAEKALTQWYD